MVRNRGNLQKNIDMEVLYMNKKILKVMSLTLIFALTFSTTIFAAVDRNYEYQQDSNWCWAASAKNMVIGERPKNDPPTISQTEAVIEVKGTPANVQGSMADAIDAAEFISEGQYEYISLARNSFFTLNNMKYMTDTAQSPIYLFLSDNETSEGHAVIIYGVNGNDLLIFDPATRNGGKVTADYYELLQGNSRALENYHGLQMMYCTSHNW